MQSLGFVHKKARALGNIDNRTVKRWCRESLQAQFDEVPDGPE
jgi:hypothetical protein